jgi:hypothetical protein
MSTDPYDAIHTEFLRGVVKDQTLSDLPVRAAIFGRLVQLAAPTLAAYESDLYHDALWINEHVTGRLSVFFFSYNEGGTTIGTDGGLNSHRANRFRVVAHIDDRDDAYLTTERLGTDRPERMRARVRDVVRLELGASEVCMHMGMTGEHRWVRVLPDGAQILRDNGMPDCPTITHGEGGFWRDGGDDFRFEPADDYPAT